MSIENNKFSVWYSEDNQKDGIINLCVNNECITLNKKEREMLKMMIDDPIPISSDGEFEDVTLKFDNYLKYNNLEFPNRNKI